MTTDANVTSLVINKLTQNQFKDIETPSETELYIASSGNTLLVSDATLTINVNGEQVGTFSANAVTNSIVNIPVPTHVANLADATTHQQSSETINAMTNYQKAQAAAAIAPADSLNTAIGKLEKALDGKQEAGDYAAEIHTHTVEDVTAMTNYEKAASAAAISTSDSLSQAIGKLEKALDGKQASGNYAEAIHQHTMADITDLDIPTITDIYNAESTDGMSGIAVASAISSALSSVMTYKGTKASYSALPASGNVVGDVWNITTADDTHGIEAGDNVAWNGTDWDNLGGHVDVSGFKTIASLQSKGSATLPVYFDANGDAQTITSYQGKAATAGVADEANAVEYSNIVNLPSEFTPAAHNQASNTINLMTGYAKASTASAIAATDTLNAAIGKLEKALDGKQASGDYAAANHDHVGSEVTLTGYTVAQEYTNIAATDTVNVAIGKLEKAVQGAAGVTIRTWS